KVSTGIHKVTIITRLSKYDRLRQAMNDLGVTGMTVTQVMGFGIQKGDGENTGALKWMLHCFLKYRLMW
ncbi:MAG: P-II family nitrogen regulator, partial [Solobacterium sp.]|nr:P-II family nitrogen regulator [Solobacterium sp.]